MRIHRSRSMNLPGWMSFLVLALAMALGLPVTAAMAAPQGAIVVAQPVLRQNFDPVNQIAMTDFMPFNMLFDGLLNLGPNGKEPGLATSWTISKDGLQMDFDLRKGVTFSNGQPFTAEDVKFTLDSIISPTSTHSYRKPFQQSIKNVEVINAHRVRLNLKQPWPAFFTSSRYALQAIVPKAYYKKVGPAGFKAKPVGTGPFMLEDMKAGEWTKFKANPHYWGKVSNVETVTKRLVSEPFTRFAMLERGEADIVMGLTGPLLKRIAENPKIRIIFSKYSGTSGLYFNTKTFPEFKDKRVRMAVAYAIDRKDIAKSILGGVCSPASEIFTPATFGYEPGLKEIPYDPAKSKDLLHEAGVDLAHPVTFSIHTQSFGSLPNAPQVLEAIAGYLEAVGFKIKRVPMETGAWLAMMRGGKQPGIFYGPSSIPDDGGSTINGWYASWSVWSAGFINVPEYDKIFKEQLQEVNLQKRKALLQKWAKLEDQKREAIPLFWCNTPFAVGPRIKVWHPGLGSGYHMDLNYLTLNR